MTFMEQLEKNEKMMEDILINLSKLTDEKGVKLFHTSELASLTTEYEKINSLAIRRHRGDVNKYSFYKGTCIDETL